MTRHFRTLDDLTPLELRQLIGRASELKRMLQRAERYEPLRNRALALIFEKSSTRTRVSFETAITQFGGNAIFLSPTDSQLARGEPPADTARVLSGMVDGIVLRTGSHATVEIFAQYASVPVINGLTDMYHPCQSLADILTWVEHTGEIDGRAAAWIGDGNNMCHSWMNAARQFGFALRIAAPRGYAPDSRVLARNGENVRLCDDPREAAEGADVVVTDAWTSMGQETEKAERETAFRPYAVDSDLMALAAADALFMHCLPAYRGCEVTADVIDGPHSVVWDQAANRLHAQKALLEFLLT